MDDLSALNGISDPSQVIAGARLLIPGLEGINGVLTTTSVPYGELMRSLSRRYHLPEKLLAKLNHLSSPSELYAGYSLVLPDAGTTITDTKHTATPRVIDIRAFSAKWCQSMADCLEQPDLQYMGDRAGGYPADSG